MFLQNFIKEKILEKIEEVQPEEDNIKIVYKN
jgi:hypothetical protein